MRTFRWTVAWSLAVMLPVAARLLAGDAGLAGSDSRGCLRYVADFVATAARWRRDERRRRRRRTSYPDPGCGPFCSPCWRPSSGAAVCGWSCPRSQGFPHIGCDITRGLVAGYAGLSGTPTRAVVWKPEGNTYQAIDLGVLPGKVVSEAMGIDDLGRVVGWSTTLSFPYNGSPFVWTETGGMVDLSAQGFPDEPPLGISPGGTVATYSAWYRLDDPGSVSFLPPRRRAWSRTPGRHQRPGSG